MTIETVIASEIMDVDRVRSTIALTINRGKAVGGALLMTKISVMPARAGGAANNTAPAGLCMEAVAITNLATGEAKAKTIAT